MTVSIVASFTLTLFIIESQIYNTVAHAFVFIAFLGLNYWKRESLGDFQTALRLQAMLMLTKSLFQAQESESNELIESLNRNSLFL